MIFQRYRELTYDRDGNILQQKQEYNTYKTKTKYNFNSIQDSSNNALPHSTTQTLQKKQNNSNKFIGWFFGIICLIVISLIIYNLKFGQKQVIKMSLDNSQNSTIDFLENNQDRENKKIEKQFADLNNQESQKNKYFQGESKNINIYQASSL